MNIADSSVDQLRTLLADLETEIAASPSVDLRRRWTAFVTALALGPAPETRVCPNCKATAMRAANRCSVCWSHLEPLA